MRPAGSRPSHVEVDLSAIDQNVRTLAKVAPQSEIMVVVKANGYGHGALPVARAAIAAGSERLAVAIVDEGVELREAGIMVPIVVLSEPSDDAFDALAVEELQPTLYSHAGIDRALATVAATGVEFAVHLKVNTGMNRVGAEPREVLELAQRISDSPGLRLTGLWTHFAVADEPDRPETAIQIARFEAVEAELSEHGVTPEVVHLANSAGAIAHPDSRRGLVRIGIAAYGLPPSPQLAGSVDLVPAMSVHSVIAHVRSVGGGEGVSYGHRFTASHDTTIATVPVGYADGVSRGFGLAGGHVLIGGRRRPVVGSVTMDQLMVDCGDDPVEVGDPVVLIGRQGSEEITADDWAELLGTINYEVICGFTDRLPRRYTE